MGAPSALYISHSTATRMYAEGCLRENRDASGRAVPDTAVWVPVEDRNLKPVTDRGYDAAPYGKDSGPHVYNVTVPAELELTDPNPQWFASDSMPVHPVRWGF